MIWIPRENAKYIVPLRYTFHRQNSLVRELVWEGDNTDIGLARYVDIYGPLEWPLAQLQAVLTACLYAPLYTSTSLHMNEPQPETIMFRKWIDDYDLDS